MISQSKTTDGAWEVSCLKMHALVALALRTGLCIFVQCGILAHGRANVVQNVPAVSREIGRRSDDDHGSTMSAWILERCNDGDLVAVVHDASEGQSWVQGLNELDDGQAAEKTTHFICLIT